jgi:hypothetical protein
MLVDSGGALWVSYFDEGIYSGDPLSANGLNCFDIATGDVRWQLSSHVPSIIEDVYALNVADDAVWAYMYPAMELAQVKPGGDLRTWRSPVEGARAVVVVDDRVLLVGSYENPWEASVWHLGSNKLEQGRPLRIEGPQFHDEAQLSARGSLLFAAADGLCLVADARSLPG